MKNTAQYLLLLFFLCASALLIKGGGAARVSRQERVKLIKQMTYNRQSRFKHCTRAGLRRLHRSRCFDFLLAKLLVAIVTSGRKNTISRLISAFKGSFSRMKIPLEDKLHPAF